jgi:hypothetical protein
MNKKVLFVLLAAVMIVASLGVAQPAYAGTGVWCNHTSISVSRDGTAITVKWNGNPHVTGAWLIIDAATSSPGLTLKGNSEAGPHPLGITISTSSAGSRANPGPATLTHSAVFSTRPLFVYTGGLRKPLNSTTFTHVELLVRTSTPANSYPAGPASYCKIFVPNFVLKAAY